MQSKVVPCVTYSSVVGKVLARRRELLRLDQADMAQALHTAQSTWSRLENGAAPLTVEQLRMAATTLKTSPDALLREADQAAAFLQKRGVRVVSKQDQTENDGLLAFIGGAALMTLIVAAVAKK